MESEQPVRAPADVPADDAVAHGPVDDRQRVRPVPDREAASLRMLAAGLAVAVAAGFAVLLLAGSLGPAGVVLAAAVEAGFVYALYRWSPSS